MFANDLLAKTSHTANPYLKGIELESTFRWEGMNLRWFFKSTTYIYFLTYLLDSNFSKCTNWVWHVQSLNFYCLV